MSRTYTKLTGKRCKCPTCGEYFGTVSNFDRHRKGKHGLNRHCVDPESVGLVLSIKGESSYWCMPGMFAEAIGAATREADHDIA